MCIVPHIFFRERGQLNIMHVVDRSGRLFKDNVFKFGPQNSWVTLFADCSKVVLMKWRCRFKLLIKNCNFILKAFSKAVLVLWKQLLFIKMNINLRLLYLLWVFWRFLVCVSNLDKFSWAKARLDPIKVANEPNISTALIRTRKFSWYSKNGAEPKVKIQQADFYPTKQKFQQI